MPVGLVRTGRIKWGFAVYILDFAFPFYEKFNFKFIKNNMLSDNRKF